MEAQRVLRAAATNGYQLDLSSVQFTLDSIAVAQTAAEHSCDEVQLPDILPAGNEASKPLDVAFFKSKLGEELGTVCDITVRDQDKMGGMSGSFQFLNIILQSGKQIAVVVKRGAASTFRATMGTAREALFYKHFGKSFSDAIIFKSYYAEADMETGAMLLLLECANNAVPAGTFFGPGNPNNWGVADKLDALCKGNPTPEALTRDAFSAYAALHAAHWNDKSLLRHQWLRAANWYRGEGKSAFQASLQYARSSWDMCKQKVADGTSNVQFDDHLVACIDASFAKTTWQAYTQALSTRPFALVHGDCHPHNVLWCEQHTALAHLRLIDFEMVGVGSPAQELGQWTISHMTPGVRRASERRLVAGYHAQVVKNLSDRGEHGLEAFSADACWSEYVAGGAGRWIWFVPVLAVMLSANAKMGQFFQDQLAEFLRDHFKDPEDAPLVRL